jgi:glycerol-3-phosphate acyltransferase PlsY
MPNEHLTDATKHIIDGASIATAIGTMMQVLPAIAALFTIIWTTIRIYETKTVQKLLGKHKG